MAKKRSMSPAKEFNDKARSYLYSVGIRAKGSRSKADASTECVRAMKQIREMAKEAGLQNVVKVQADDGTLGRRGIFFMNAPAKFAAQIRKLEGVHYVEQPSEQRPLSASVKRSKPGAKARR